MSDEHDYGTVEANFEDGMIVFRQVSHGMHSEVSLSPSTVRAFKRSLERDEEPKAGGPATEEHAILQTPGKEARLLESPSADGSKIILLPTPSMIELFDDGLRAVDRA